MANKDEKLASAHLNNKVGPILRQGALATAVAEAAEIDNPDKKISVEDKMAYVRVMTDGEMLLKRATIEEMLGKPFKMHELEVELSSFAGRIDFETEQVRFFFEKTF